jgi:Asp-tRNA(Asn)/Glu-tRNA(Gln) amidotransferase B subunit
VTTANPGPAADFKAGKAAALNFLKGQVMKLSKGKANPALAGEILERKLKGLCSPLPDAVEPMGGIRCA